MMTETHGSEQQTGPRRPTRTGGRAKQRIIGGIWIAIAVAVAVWALATWVTGQLNAVNALVFALAIVGTLPPGLLALQGDYVGTMNMDEGQREMSRAAQSDAFYVAYFGLFALFFGYDFIPAMRPYIQLGIGLVLLAVILTWHGSYMGRRWRP